MLELKSLYIWWGGNELDSNTFELGTYGVIRIALRGEKAYVTHDTSMPSSNRTVINLDQAIGYSYKTL